MSGHLKRRGGHLLRNTAGHLINNCAVCLGCVALVLSGSWQPGVAGTYQLVGGGTWPCCFNEYADIPLHFTSFWNGAPGDDCYNSGLPTNQWIVSLGTATGHDGFYGSATQLGIYTYLNGPPGDWQVEIQECP